VLLKWTDFIEQPWPGSGPARFFVNSRYQVIVRRHQSAVEGAPDLVHLSICRVDKQPVGSERYRDFELIKDLFIGQQCEAVEIYPARNREADTSTQYHLWGFDDPTFRFPFGYGDRLVMEPAEVWKPGARQNPFEPHHPR
jgi:hypothetical protein